MSGPSPVIHPTPTIMPLGDGAFLVRFGESLNDQSNEAAVALAQELASDPLDGVIELVPGLISVLLRYDPLLTAPQLIAGELRLRVAGLGRFAAEKVCEWQIPVMFDGPDIAEVSSSIGMAVDEFIASHNARPLRVLATGFAPGFVYCGLHAEELNIPRRPKVRPFVPAGSVLFAAGQTAIAATDMPTGWHIIGRTDFANFDASKEPPTLLSAGDVVEFEARK